MGFVDERVRVVCVRGFGGIEENLAFSKVHQGRWINTLSFQSNLLYPDYQMLHI